MGSLPISPSAQTRQNYQVKRFTGTWSLVEGIVQLSHDFPKKGLESKAIGSSTARDLFVFLGQSTQRER